MANNKIRRTVGTQSVSGPSGPSKAAPSVEYAPNKLGEGSTKTVTDGQTEVMTNAGISPEEKKLNKWLGKSLRERAGAITIREWRKHGPENIPPCINPSCRSYGRPHPNCLCYAGPGGSSLEGGLYAHGGQVCQGPHKESCEHYADGGVVAENLMMQNNPKDTVDHVAAHHGLLGLLTKTGFSKSEDPHKHTIDYIEHSRRGHKEIHNHVKNLFGDINIQPDKDHRESLKNHLQFLRENPEKMLDIGGNLGDNLPDHAGLVAATSGSAINHLNGLKPIRHQNSPLDTLSETDENTENNYDRHLDIAQNPSIILQHVKDGTLLPNDVKAIQTMYPALYKNIAAKAGEALIDAKTKKLEIPYKQKQSLSLLLGEPLDSTMTPQSMQAIIQSAAPQQAKQQMRKQPKASGSELSQINKVNSMDATTLEARQIRKNK